jgi:hypothetical protein
LGSLVVDNAVLGGRNVSIHCADGVIADIRVDGADGPGGNEPQSIGSTGAAAWSRQG